MNPTTKELNLYKLMLCCESKLNSEPVETWTASEKRKFAAFVKFISKLTAEEKPQNPRPFMNNLDRLKRAVIDHNMHVAVETGVPEARLVKKKHAEELKQLEKTDPEWLLELKQQDEQNRLEEASRKKKLLEEDLKEEEAEEEVEEEYEEEKKAVPSEIRQRNPTRQDETSNIEHVLQHHRQMHDELTTDLGRMAQQLKMNSQALGDTLTKDDVVLREAQQAVESNLERMTKERKRLDEHYSKSWGTSFMTMGVVFFVCIMFILVFFTIKFLPKV
ncbi:vesicle transport protein [Mucor mucedo]|uniref:vesicle transport protein n=1 Tax=Mucor mucedo TaxID=29922 RepID=UPI00221E9CD8|nr:vesicle transport protein [Mucor mucedo]KAI7895270.1 vesicle transport protein [Mucor mucedo]